MAMIFRMPIDRSMSVEIAQELVRVGDEDFEIKIGDVAMVVVNPGGVIGENVAQMICDLRREIIGLADAIRPVRMEDEPIRHHLGF